LNRLFSDPLFSGNPGGYQQPVYFMGNLNGVASHL